MADLWTVETWKKAYLFGIPDTDPKTGEAFPREMYDVHLETAYSWLETYLNIAIREVVVEDERHDYHAEQYMNWGFLRTFKRPVKSFALLQGKYPYYNSAITFPAEWIGLDKLTGQINLVPSSGTMTSFIMEAGGMFLPHLFRYQSYVPRFFALNYTAGFEDGEIPVDLNDAAAKIACMSVMNVLGDLIGGVGVLGGSIGLDGLSQFLSMTKTATTGAFYARVLQYRTELYGSNGGGPGSQLHALKRKYRGVRLGVV